MSMANPPQKQRNPPRLGRMGWSRKVERATGFITRVRKLVEQLCLLLLALSALFWLAFEPAPVTASVFLAFLGGLVWNAAKNGTTPPREPET